jgi:hypothetical protein
MKYFILCLLLFFQSIYAKATDNITDIWPTIPFVRGADLCRYKDAYGQSRTEYISKMTFLATQLMKTGANGEEAINLLKTFNSLYDRNLAIATQHQYLDVTLESTLKSYIDGYYRNLRPREKKLSFTNVNDLLSIIRATNNGQREGYMTNDLLRKLDYIAIGTYSFAPNCAGDILVTIQLIGKNGTTHSFMGNGQPQYVMSQIGSQMFSFFQGTKFPSQLKIGKYNLTILGGLNGNIEKTTTVENANNFCETLDARLPTGLELEIIGGYGDWSGGVSIGDKYWALSDNKIYAPHLKNPSPIRNPYEVYADEVYYYCVK